MSVLAERLLAIAEALSLAGVPHAFGGAIALAYCTGEPRATIDLFFNTHAFHAVAASRVRLVPFAETSIPVVDCTSLAVFKAMSNRTKDWADLEAMSEAGQLDTVAVGAFLADLLGDDERLRRLANLDRLR